MAFQIPRIENDDDQESYATHSLKGLYFSIEGYEHPMFLPDEALVEIKRFLPLLPFKKSTWWAGVKSGRFPAGKRLGNNKTVWTVGQIRQVLFQLSQ